MHLVITCFLYLQSIVISFSQQSIFIIESEEDLQALLEEQWIDPEQHAKLLDLFIHKIDINSDDLSPLRIIPGVSQYDLDQIQTFRLSQGWIENFEKLANLPHFNYTLIKSFVMCRQRDPRLLGSFRQKLSRSWSTEEPLILNSQNKIGLSSLQTNFSMILSQRLSSAEKPEWIERGIALQDQNKHYQIRLGNFSQSFGYGLNLGNGPHNLTLKSFRGPPAPDFFIPERNNFNGVSLSSNLNKLTLSSLLSFQNQGPFSDRVMALEIKSEFKPFVIGLIGIQTSLIDSSGLVRYLQKPLGGFIRLTGSMLRGGCEVSFLNHGPLAFLADIQLLLENHFLEATTYHYPAHYLNLYSSAEVQSDRWEAILQDSLRVSTAQAGETGVTVKSSYPLNPSLTFKTFLNSWSPWPDPNIRYFVLGELEFQYHQSHGIVSLSQNNHFGFNRQSKFEINFTLPGGIPFQYWVQGQWLVSEERTIVWRHSCKIKKVLSNFITPSLSVTYSTNNTSLGSLPTLKLNWSEEIRFGNNNYFRILFYTRSILAARAGSLSEKGIHAELSTRTME